LKVLITGAKSRTAGIIANGLAARHDIVLTDLNGGGGATACELGHDAATDQLVAGIDAIVHTGYEAQEGDVSQLIDYHTRRTYNLLLAASQAGVRRVVHISTLRLFDGYEENLTVTEKWRSLPPADDPQLLACHLGEIVCKEFARDRLIETVNLRLGFPIVDDGPEAASASGESAAVDAETVAAAVLAALECEAAQWQDVHVQSPVPNQRFLLHAATDLLKLQAAGVTGGGR
jgi:nucleoside-diphosphate-sugar epimerase